MNKEKIAVLCDSCSDVPEKYLQKYHIFVLPLKVIYKNKEYLDGVNITPQEVYQSMEQEIPSTSLPDGSLVKECFEKIKQEGYQKVIVITLSSGLSGTNNLIRLIAKDENDLDIEIIDTKNIAIGSGFHAIQACKYIEEGLNFQEIVDKIKMNIKDSKVFFVVKSLEYLHKGGRIGLVANLFGNALNLKPIISCNDNGIYYTVSKVRGRKQSISKTMDLALKQIGTHKHYHLAIVHGDAKDECDEVIAKFKEQIKQADEFVEGQISPCLGVHTGPGLIGIGVYILD